MNATEARNISDEANEIDEGRIDAHYDHIEIEILETAKGGYYSLEYEFLSAENKKFGEVNAFKNRLKSAGFEVEIIEKEDNAYSLLIDWSSEEL